MQRVNEFVFYDLAIRVHVLTDEPDEAKYSQVWWRWSQARDALADLFSQRPLNFTTTVGNKLYEAINAVLPAKFDDMFSKLQTLKQQGEQEPDLEFWQIHQVRESAKEFETVLRNECHIMDTYFLTQKGTYSTIALVEHAHFQVPEPTRSKLPDLTKQDFDQAGKCIAFDVPTAAAFHLLRGTEVVIREYYELIVPGPKQASKKMRNWGTYIRLLKHHGADEKVTALLTHLKDVYRNPVFHPEEVYTDERVQVLFGICVSAVVVIKSAIAAPNSSKITLFGGLLGNVAKGA